MKKFLTIVFGLLFIQYITAQVEQLSPLRSNPPLYYSTKGIVPSKPEHRYLVDKATTIVMSDTLSLPFVDDFSTNRLRSYKWIENHVTDTLYNVAGGCLANEGVNTIVGYFVSDTAWFYTYNVALQQLDSTPQERDSITYFGPTTSECFSQPHQTLYYWPAYYRYPHFDSITGFPKDSLLVSDLTISYAPVVYFAQGEKGTLWFDNYAYVNNTYPVNPPTIGVATLDGLDEFGEPYNNSNSTTYGTADYLTSKQINLSGFNANDNSLYLSFFYEAEGLGDRPERNDSLILEFRDNGDTWQYMWGDTGYTFESSVPQQFRQVLINVGRAIGTTHILNDTLTVFDSLTNTTFFYPTFQFRFRNLASLSGNNDHWHIDYVKLDKSRSIADTAIHDIAFVYPMPTILKNYTQLPANLFAGLSDLKDSIVLTVHNLDPNADANKPATNFTNAAEELYPTPSVVFTGPVATFNATSYNYILINPATEYNISDVLPVDSMVIVSKVSVTPNDNRPQNDTLTQVQDLNYVMAYDDGSAERAYGISGLGLKKFAYEFDLAHPDTLAGFQIMLTQVDRDVSDLVFNFEAWDSIHVATDALDYSFVDSPIITLTNRRPLYIDSVNGFATYVLEIPIIISGKFYFGWAQTDERSLQIGYDLNSTLGKQHMFVYKNGQWNASLIEPAGSPMIRLILDSRFRGPGSPNAVIDLTKQNDQLNVFPNPTSGLVNIQNETRNASYEVSVTNVMGQMVQYEGAVKNHFSINQLPNGVYLLATRDISTGKTYHSKVIKTSF